MLKNLKRIVVIGAGEMGHGIAQSSLMAGFKVTLFDINKEGLKHGEERIFESLNKLYEKNKIKLDVLNFSKRNLKTTTNFNDAVKNANFIFEAVPEVLSIKKNIFKRLEESVSKETILASNTSNMSISKIVLDLKHPERVVGIHFFNPVVLMKLVEVIKGNQTSEEVMLVAIEICEKMNKTPIRLEKDSPAFIVNRINGAVRTYLGAVIDSGVETPEKIDALLLSNGERMGHFELNDFIGLDTVYNSSIYRQDALHNDHKPYKILTDLYNKNHLGKKSEQGFYNWSEGRPKINLEEKADEKIIENIKYIKLNEASKLIEKKIATAENIDLAMILGTADKIGPIKNCKGVEEDKITKRLKFIAKKYRKEILLPTDFVNSGYYNK